MCRYFYFLVKIFLLHNKLYFGGLCLNKECEVLVMVQEFEAGFSFPKSLLARFISHLQLWLPKRGYKMRREVNRRGEGNKVLLLDAF